MISARVSVDMRGSFDAFAMDTDMVIHAMGKPPKKVREQNGDVEYEDWIYGEPPQDVEFVRILGDEVVRIESVDLTGGRSRGAVKQSVARQSLVHARDMMVRGP